MALIAFIIGIPLFFEVGVVLLIPVVMLVARRSKLSMILVGIPALAGLSALHGSSRRTPARSSRSTRSAPNLGMTLGLGLLVAIPTVIIAGPLLAKPLDPVGACCRHPSGLPGQRRAPTRAAPPARASGTAL